MTPMTIARCQDCRSAVPESPKGWLRCPTCEAVYCPQCPGTHRDDALGECDSTKVCTACGSTCLVEI